MYKYNHLTEKYSDNYGITHSYILLMFFSFFFFFKQIAMLIFNFDSPQSFSHMPNLRGCSEVERAFLFQHIPVLHCVSP